MEGFDYGKAVALEKLADYIEKPEAFIGFYLEKDEFDSLDDIILLHSDGRISAIQVKCSLHPARADDRWSWEDLLKRQKGKSGRMKDSLLQKWEKSLSRLRSGGEPVLGFLETNRLPADDIAVAIDETTGAIQFELAPRDAKARIVKQLGSEQHAESFFANFWFRFGQPSRAEREEAAIGRLKKLNLSDTQCEDLKRAIWDWMKYEPNPGEDRPLDLEDIRAAVGWKVLRRIPERFEIPVDYIEPDAEFHQVIREAIASAVDGGTCLVVEGSPGSGKSTFLSHLVDELRESRLPVLRHHFFLSLRDVTRLRGSYQTTAESLMWQIQTEFEAELGTLAKRNPDAADLGEWIEAVGAALAATGKSLTVIVDGLDHVWRQGAYRDDLFRLFDQLLPVPKGVALLVGTQHVGKEHMPPKLVRAIPKENWIDLPLLSRQSAINWFAGHMSDLGIDDASSPSADYLRKHLGEAFWRKTHGHPLSMRYMLRALLNGPLPITVSLVDNQPDCPKGRIREYYDSLLMSLDEVAREILHLLCLSEFPIPRTHICRIMNPDGDKTAEVMAAHDRVGHLLAGGPLGVRPFHSSLVEHIRSLPTHGDYLQPLQSRIERWLENGAPAHWKWAYAPPFASPTPSGRDEPWEWALEGIIHRQIPELGKAALGEYAAAALRADDVGAAVNGGLLKDYFEAATERNNEEILETLLPAQLYLQDDEHLVARLEEALDTLSEAELVVLAEWADQHGLDGLFRRSVDQLVDLLRDPDRTSYGGDSLGRVRHYVRLAGSCASTHLHKSA